MRKYILIIIILNISCKSQCQFADWLSGFFGSSEIELVWPHTECESYLIYKENSNSDYQKEVLENTNNRFILDRNVIEQYFDILILPYNGRLTMKDDILEKETLKENHEIEIGIFGIPELNIDKINKINAGLRKLYTGIQVNFNFVGNNSIPSYNFRQNDYIVEKFAENNYIDHSKYDFHIFLNDNAQFPNGSGCQAQVIRGKVSDNSESIEKVILSRTSFFDNIFLVIHEICHFFEGNDHNYRCVYYDSLNTEKRYLDVMSSNPFYCRYTHSFKNLKNIHLGIAYEQCDLEFYPLVKDTLNIQCELPFDMNCVENPGSCGLSTQILSIVDEKEFLPSDYKDALIDIAGMQYDIYFANVSNNKQLHIDNLISHTTSFIKNGVIENLHRKTGLSIKELNNLSANALIEKYTTNNVFRVPVYDEQNNLIISKKVEINNKYYVTDKFGFIKTKLSNKFKFNSKIESKQIHQLNKDEFQIDKISNLKRN